MHAVADKKLIGHPEYSVGLALVCGVVCVRVFLYVIQANLSMTRVIPISKNLSSTQQYSIDTLAAATSTSHVYYGNVPPNSVERSTR